MKLTSKQARELGIVYKAAADQSRKARRASRNSAHTPLVNAVVELLHRRGAVVWQNDSGAVYDPVRKCFRKSGKKRRGIADVIACLTDGTFAAFEVKTGKAKLTDDQESFRDDVLRAGGLFVLVRSLSDVEEALGQRSQ